MGMYTDVRRRLEVATRGGQGDIVFPSRVAGTTIGCGAFFAATAILHVMSNAVRVLEPGALIIWFLP
jgi:cleavage and polyadenylation specificity factor subunit 1